MSLIYTAELSGVNPLDYLTELLKHPEELRRSPHEWMPWNCSRQPIRRATLRDAAPPAGSPSFRDPRHSASRFREHRSTTSSTIFNRSLWSAQHHSKSRASLSLDQAARSPRPILTAQETLPMLPTASPYAQATPPSFPRGFPHQKAILSGEDRPGRRSGDPAGRTSASSSSSRQQAAAEVRAQVPTPAQ